jgi:two-component system chemotaxis response regulator CheB
MIVDDSAVVRGMVSRWLDARADIVVVAMAVDGLQAIKKLEEHEIDVCVLDIEMPNMSGLEALPKLLALRPRLKIIMASTLSERGAEITLRALSLGATDFIPKPSTSRIGGAEAYQRDLIEKIVQLGRRRAPASERPIKSYLKPPAALAPAASTAPAVPVAPTARSGPRSSRKVRLEALVVASSTGGPPALREVISGLGANWRGPILIAQHMPQGFTRALAEMIGRVTPMTVKEGENGEPVVDGVIYIAPGGSHMIVERGPDGTPTVQLNQGPEVHWCRPAADPLFISAAGVWGSAAAGLVLTGMGHDGRDGARALADCGAPVMVQDEASSVVWGMPGSVIQAGVPAEIHPLSALAPQILQWTRLGTA